MSDLLVWPGLVLLGVAVGAYGTMIGAGGGFLLVPLLVLIYPDEPRELLTSMSIGVVFFNALSGTAAYLHQRRIDFVAGNAFALATVPGAVVGSLVTGLLPIKLFDLIFALLLIAVVLLIVVRRQARVMVRTHRRGEVSRLIADTHGDTYLFSYNLWHGMALSLAIGFISSAFGIGGGLFHVPMMIQVLRFPALIATATSQYVLTFTSATSAIVHLIAGDYEGGYAVTGALAVGVVMGAQIGAMLSVRLNGVVIVRLMAVALTVLAARLLMTALG